MCRMCLQFHVLREKGTEPPNTGEYNKGDFAGGHFACRGCGAKLYRCAHTLPSLIPSGS